MKKHLLLAAAASLALAVPAHAQMNSPGAGTEQVQLAPADQNFVTKATIGGLFEVESSELAEDKAQSAEVKDFAAQMIRDHGKANNELESLADDLGAEQPSRLDAKHQQVLQELEGASEGSAFDQAYLKAQRDAHREAISLFSKQSQAGGNPELASWAQKTLPTLQEHARHLDRIAPAGVASGEGESSGSGRSAAEPQPRPQQNR